MFIAFIVSVVWIIITVVIGITVYDMGREDFKARLTAEEERVYVALAKLYKTIEGHDIKMSGAKYRRKLTICGRC